jgi:hypothetical protein
MQPGRWMLATCAVTIAVALGIPPARTQELPEKLPTKEDPREGQQTLSRVGDEGPQVGCARRAVRIVGPLYFVARRG